MLPHPLDSTYRLGFGFTVTVTLSVAVHPLASVTVTVYVVIVVGDAVGLGEDALPRPVGGFHRYVSVPFPPEPVGVPPIPTEPPEQMT